MQCGPIMEAVQSSGTNYYVNSAKQAKIAFSAPALSLKETAACTTDIADQWETRIRIPESTEKSNNKPMSGCAKVINSCISIPTKHSRKNVAPGVFSLSLAFFFLNPQWKNVLHSLFLTLVFSKERHDLLHKQPNSHLQSIMHCIKGCER